MKLKIMSQELVFNTGNILNLLDIKKKAGQNVTEELSESLKITISEWREGKAHINGVQHSDDEGADSPNVKTITIKSSSEESITSSHNMTKPLSSHDGAANGSSSGQHSIGRSVNYITGFLSISRSLHDVKEKMLEEEKKNLKVGVKIFIDVDKAKLVNGCLEGVLQSLDIDCIDNVILAYYPASGEISTTSSEVDIHKTGENIISEIEKDADEHDSELDIAKCDTLLPGIMYIWQVFEEYVRQGKILQLGLADSGVRCLRRLHQWAKVKPSIAQINLATCCVVPPALQDFCKSNDVQLLTHADPPDLLSAAATKGLDGMSCERLDWCARYQVHIKCRGVLCLKGYICKATVANSAT